MGIQSGEKRYSISLYWETSLRNGGDVGETAIRS